jgi:hypothetical protein
MTISELGFGGLNDLLDNEIVEIGKNRLIISSNFFGQSNISG